MHTLAQNKMLITIITFLLATSVLANAGKRGLPFNNPSTYVQHFNANFSSQVTWAYNWDSYMDSTFPTKVLEYVPLLWGDKAVHTKGWAANVATAKTHGSKHLLAFNEPDGCYPGQACMSPAAAVAAYKQYMMPYANTFLLGAPVVTNGGAGLPWLTSFLALCTGCKVDFVPIHWYDSATNVPYFKNYMASAHAAAGGRDLWITEFNGHGTNDQQITFLKTILPWLDAQTYIARYAWQWCSPKFTGGTLVLDSGLPSQLGGVYAYTP